MGYAHPGLGASCNSKNTPGRAITEAPFLHDDELLGTGSIIDALAHSLRISLSLMCTSYITYHSITSLPCNRGWEALLAKT